MQHRQAVAAAAVAVVGAALIITATIDAIGVRLGEAMRLVGALMVLGAFIGWTAHAVNVRVASVNRPADEAFEHGVDVGYERGAREQSEECRRSHMRVVRPIRH